MNKTVKTIGLVALVLVLMGASFAAGMFFQRTLDFRARSAFLQGNGNFPGGNFPGGPGNGSAPGEGFGGGLGGGTALGQIKTIDGNTISLSTARNVTTVHMDESTLVQKAGSAAASDLQTGERVIIIGQRGADGSITASQVLIISTP